MEEFIADLEMAYTFDTEFVATGTGTTVTAVPEGFCDSDVYLVQADAEFFLEELEGAASYAEWLAARVATDSEDTEAALDEEREKVEAD